ncbi:hypothetical protein FAZ95_15985 [Trinickia violacea]|uniref:Uncharacterized protein n=1 Tax=Trinickia violacea TaxID=2571746 RepID=A0A4P8IT83_9BURK|nr:hypothetical protein [Trinickia violacea]QCP50523.1 hypothetical protein FAZ95_15985 [Trinickia violacea]
MSLASFSPTRKRPLLATLFAVLVSLALPVAASAQEAADANPLQMANLVVAETWPTLAPLPQSLIATRAVLEFNAAPAAGNDALDAGDDALPVNAPPLDDQVLSRQRGGREGMVMLAATPQLMKGGNAVTLWDEIAPPAPLPVPVDSGRAAQGNVASYTRQ